MKPTTPGAARPVTWFSLPAEDPERATSFYQRAFGWRIEPVTREQDARYDYQVVVSSPSDAAYVPRRSGRVNGCIVRRAIGVTTPVVLVEVPDLDQATADVVAAGGSVVSERPIPMTSLDGAFVLVKDPEGNLLELFRSNTP